MAPEPPAVADLGGHPDAGRRDPCPGFEYQVGREVFPAVRGFVAEITEGFHETGALRGEGRRGYIPAGTLVAALLLPAV